MRGIICAIFMLTGLGLFAQEFNQTISGTIKDKDSKEPLIGASIILAGSSPLLGTVTDADGHFELSGIPVGRKTFVVSYIGYQEIVIPEVLVTTGKQVVLNIELEQSFAELEEAVVKASSADKDKTVNTMASVSARKLNMDDAARYAGGFYDAARMVSAFAGVTAVEGDGVNDIIIRGNSSRGLLWRLEGIEIPNPNHFSDGQGGTGGAVSIISSHMLATSDFYTGAFPSEYGNASAGIMDLNLRNGSISKKEYAFQLSVVGTELAMEGNFNNKSNASYLLNYRYSTLGYLSSMGLIDLGNNNLPPVFQDLTFKVNLPTKAYGTFSLFGVGGLSNTGTDPVRDTLQWETFDDRYFETEYHRMGIAGLRHFILFRDNKTSLRSTAAITYQSDEWEEGWMDENYTRQTNYTNSFAYPSLRTSAVLNTKINLKNLIRTGFLYSQLHYDLIYKRYSNSLMAFDTLANSNGFGSMIQSFVQWKHRFSAKTEINAGMHHLYFALNGHSSLEPRLGLSHQLNEKSRLSIGFGIHSRVEAISAYLALINDGNNERRPINKNIEPAKALHAVMAYDWSFSPQWRLKSEAYYQHLYNVPESANTSSKTSSLNFGHGIPDIALDNSGRGYNYGLEITLERFFSKHYYLMATSSLFDSKFKAPDGQWHNTVYNAGFVGNLLAGKDFPIGNKKQNIFGLNTKLVYRGGYRYSPYIENVGEFDLQKYNEAQLPAFFRMDIGSYLRINHLRYAYIISADIQNASNRKNVMGYYISDENGLQAFEGNGLIPILNFRIEW